MLRLLVLRLRLYRVLPPSWSAALLLTPPDADALDWARRHIDSQRP